MTRYTGLLAGLKRGLAGRIEAEIPPDWMQGRTTYGGLTAALCLEGARALAGDKPVRSAHVAFIGPVGGAVVISPTLLREGRNTAFVNVDLVGEEGVAARCLFAFGAPRQSAFAYSRLEAPLVDLPDDAPSFFEGDRRPEFARHFNLRLVRGARPVSGAADADLALWLRHTDEAAPLDATTLLSLADAPPPAAMSLFTAPAPISSMTWMAEFLTETVETEGGWFLAHHVAEAARNGYSSQAMRLFNSRGEAMMIGRQSVAIFA